MKKLLNWLKRDFQSVAEGVNYTFNGRIPKWVILLWYVIMLPIGYTLAVIVKIGLTFWYRRILYKIVKGEREL